jgi:glycosyltransferase involved in cell wall biosynthesis
MSVWMVEVKGVDVLLKAAAPLMKANSQIWLLLIGDGPKLEEYRTMARDLGIAEHTVFPGLLSDPVGLGVFDASDVSCQPSLWQEANPLAVLEAMSMKLPVIASDIGGLPEIVKDHETGLLFPPGDSDALRAKLTRLAGDPALRSAMGEAGRRRVLEHHRIEVVAAKYADILTA